MDVVQNTQIWKMGNIYILMGPAHKGPIYIYAQWDPRCPLMYTVQQSLDNELLLHPNIERHDNCSSVLRKLI